MISRKCFVFLWVVCLLSSPVFVEGLDIDLTAPGMKILGVDIPRTVWDPILNRFEDEIKDSDIRRYTSPRKVVRAIANAGAAATHFASQRSFPDYRVFAFVLGGGMAVSTPTDVFSLYDIADDLSDDGDAYLGAAFQPVTVSFGVNLSRWVDRLRVDVKYGYFNPSIRSGIGEVTFQSMTVGVGAHYQLIETVSTPLGVIRWRGVTLGSGLNYQSNRGVVEYTISNATKLTEGETKSLKIPVTQTDLGVTVAGAPETIGHIVLPPLGTKLEVNSRSWSIPLEVTTGFRTFYLFEMNLGFGVDLAFGHAELALGSNAEVDFEPAAGVSESMISVDPGSAHLGTSEESHPQFLRPRITWGFVFNFGPLKFDMPVMHYIDQEGVTMVLAVNVVTAW